MVDGGKKQKNSEISGRTTIAERVPVGKLGRQEFYAANHPRKQNAAFSSYPHQYSFWALSFRRFGIILETLVTDNTAAKEQVT